MSVETKIETMFVCTYLQVLMNLYDVSIPIGNQQCMHGRTCHTRTTLPMTAESRIYRRRYPPLKRFRQIQS